MSGSGSSGFSGAGYGENVSCDRLVIVTQIASPKEPVIRKLEIGSVLGVGLENQSGTSVIVLIYQNEKAGGIASAKAINLRQCIEQGTVYVATVQSINDGQVVVRIKAS